MGCEVKGPGEAMDADLGLAFSKNYGYIFKNGKMTEKLPPTQAPDRLIELIQQLINT